MKYPVLAIDPSSFVYLLRSEADVTQIPMFYISIFRKKKDTLEFFDSEGFVWKIESVAPAKPLAFWHRILPSIRNVDVSITFQAIGPRPVEHMKNILRQAVEADDDILTQHQERKDILGKIADTKSVGEVFRLYRWMMKDFRKGPNQSSQPTRAKSPRG